MADTPPQFLGRYPVRYTTAGPGATTLHHRRRTAPKVPAVSLSGFLRNFVDRPFCPVTVPGAPDLILPLLTENPFAANFTNYDYRYIGDTRVRELLEELAESDAERFEGLGWEVAALSYEGRLHLEGLGFALSEEREYWTVALKG
ncbi:hypothetical protein MBLNU230_g3451t1 [Neophaeotheca triangularis]